MSGNIRFPYSSKFYFLLLNELKRIRTNTVCKQESYSTVEKNRTSQIVRSMMNCDLESRKDTCKN